jgi:hypothetical protein
MKSSQPCSTRTTISRNNQHPNRVRPQTFALFWNRNMNSTSDPDMGNIPGWVSAVSAVVAVSHPSRIVSCTVRDGATPDSSQGLTTLPYINCPRRDEGYPGLCQQPDLPFSIRSFKTRSPTTYPLYVSLVEFLLPTVIQPLAVAAYTT